MKALQRASRGHIVILTGLCNERKTRIELMTRMGSLKTEIYLEGSHNPNIDHSTFETPEENDACDVRFKHGKGTDFLVKCLE